MSSVKTERYSLSFFNWEVSLTFAWSTLIYLVIFKISRNQKFYWSASAEIDFTPHHHVETENLADTFIGKLLSEGPNSEQNQTDWKISTMYNLRKTISIGTYAFTFDFYIYKQALIIEFLFENSDPTQRISIEFNTSSFLLSYIDRLIGIDVDD